MQRLFLIVFLLCLFILSPSHILAATPGVAVTPSILRLDLRTDPAEAMIYYKNLSAQEQTISVSAKDFTNIPDLGTLSFLDKVNEKDYHYGLTSWIRFETNTFTLSPGEQKTLRVYIEKEKLPQGGHYAAILASVEQKDTEKKVLVKGILSSLVFVRAATGYEREEGQIAEVGHEEPFPYFPSQLFFRFQNTGNVDASPYGLLTVTDMFGGMMARGIVNDASLTTLPESIRKYTVSLKNTVPFMLPGAYHAVFIIHTANNKQVYKKELSFYSQGSLDLVKIGTILLILLISFWLYRKWKAPFVD